MYRLTIVIAQDDVSVKTDGWALATFYPFANKQDLMKLVTDVQGRLDYLFDQAIKDLKQHNNEK